MINKNAKKESLEEMFEPRVYQPNELRDFHQKIQKFWGEPREVRLDDGMSGTAQKFNHQELAVAFGAARKVKHGIGYVYLYNDRNKDLVNLWNQYEDWRKKQDWVEDKKTEELEQIANEIPF